MDPKVLYEDNSSSVIHREDRTNLDKKEYSRAQARLCSVKSYHPQRQIISGWLRKMSYDQLTSVAHPPVLAHTPLAAPSLMKLPERGPRLITSKIGFWK